MNDSAANPSAPSAAGDTAFFGHPRGLSTLFFAEMWERFSYYGMRAILILFMTAAVTQGGLGFPTGKAGLIYGTYTSMVYLMCVPGGWLADKFLGLRRSVLIGGIIIMCGHISLAIPSVATFYLGLAFVVIGTGLLKPNISAMVGGLYGAEDTRRDAGFSIYYMGINLGAFLSPLVVGWLAQSDAFKGILSRLGITPENSWHFGFAMAAVGMCFGLTWYLKGLRHLGEVGKRPAQSGNPEEALRNRRILQWGLGLVLGLIALTAILTGKGIIATSPEKVGRIFGYVLAVTPFLLFPYLYFRGGLDRQEKKRLIVIIALFFGSAIFWSMLEQAGSTLNLFAERNTENSITMSLAVLFSLILLVPAYLAIRWYRALATKHKLATGFVIAVAVLVGAGIYYLLTHVGEAFPSSFFQSVGPLFIVALAPLFATLWIALGNRQPSSPAKFTIGLLFAALGFAVLIAAVKLSAAGVKVSPLWLMLTYLLHTLGELCLSPVGLSAMTKLAPQRIVGLVLGIWFLATSLANFMAGFAASLYESMPLSTLLTVITCIALVATVMMAATVGPIRRMLARD